MNVYIGEVVYHTGGYFADEIFAYALYLITSISKFGF